MFKSNQVAIGAIRVYQRIFSPFLPRSCRFYPSCSAYAAESIERYGVVRGSIRTVKRLSRCHPWHGGGYDPVD